MVIEAEYRLIRATLPGAPPLPVSIAAKRQIHHVQVAVGRVGVAELILPSPLPLVGSRKLFPIVNPSKEVVHQSGTHGARPTRAEYVAHIVLGLVSVVIPGELGRSVRAAGVTFPCSAIVARKPVILVNV